MTEFKKNDRVQYSEKAKRELNSQSRLGTVSANPRSSDFVSVRWDGNKSSFTFHSRFIEKTLS
jgi:hypothetical protein